MTMREYVDGGQVIRVRGLTQNLNSDRSWTYAWHGKKELEVGDQLILVIQVSKNVTREWEVEVSGLGSVYPGEIVKIGGVYGLGYPMLSR